MSYHNWEQDSKNLYYRDEFVSIQVRRVVGESKTSDRKVSERGFISYYITTPYEYEVVYAKRETEYCGGGEILKRLNCGTVSTENYTKAKQAFNLWLREYLG